MKTKRNNFYKLLTTEVGNQRCLYYPDKYEMCKNCNGLNKNCEKYLTSDDVNSRR